MNTLFNKRIISLSLAGIIASTSLAFSANATSDLQNGENATNGWSQTQTPFDVEESAVSSQEDANTTQQVSDEERKKLDEEWAKSREESDRRIKSLEQRLAEVNRQIALLNQEIKMKEESLKKKWEEPLRKPEVSYREPEQAKQELRNGGFRPSQMFAGLNSLTPAQLIDRMSSSAKKQIILDLLNSSKNN